VYHFCVSGSDDGNAVTNEVDMRLVILAFIMVMMMMNESSGQTGDSLMLNRYTKVPSGFLMVLRQGDDLIKELESFATRENIPSASFTGMGFVNITFGFFDFKTKQYNPRDFMNVELASMHGTIAWKKKVPSIHCHGVVGDKNFQSFAGHILNATVGTGSLEILIIVHEKALERKKDESIGADVLQIE